MEGALSSAIVSEKPNIKWSDVKGLDAAKTALQEAVIIPIRFPQVFNSKRKPWKGILLYGPPGTGKSFLAKACATECEGTFFSVSSSDLVSKWQGESEKLIKTLFKMARAKKPSIVFIDEIDSMCGERSDGDNESSRRIKTEFLTQMDGVGNDMNGVLVLGATNTPWSLDQAIRRRFQKRIYIPLPDEIARAHMFKGNIGDNTHTLQDADWNQLGAESEMYSGSDIAVVSNDALMQPVRKCQNATYYKNTPDGGVTPTFPSDKEGFPMKMYDIDPPSKLRVPDITVADFLKALTNCRPSVGKEDLTRFEEWTAEFGQEG